MIALARAAIQPVASESAGPPCGGLYLKPPSAGGLWLGVTTMPSATSSSPCASSRFQRRIACESAGVGHQESRESASTRTPLATSTSSAVSSAGLESPWVSRPMKRGPVMPCSARCSTIACVIARMWSSLNAVFSELPRWPLVPNATFCSGSSTSGWRSWYARISSSMSMRSDGRAAVPARSCMDPSWHRARPIPI